MKKILFLAILTAPTIVAFFVIAFRLLTNWPAELPMSVGLIPLLSLSASVALSFVFPNSKEWKLAAAIDSVPFILLLPLGLVLVG